MVTLVESVRKLVWFVRLKPIVNEFDSSESQYAILHILFSHFRYTLPLTEGKPNVTVLDTQIRKLRSRALSQIHEAAVRMRSEVPDVKSTLVEIEDWLDKLMQLTEEVGLSNFIWYGSGILQNGTRGRDGVGKI